MAQLTLTQNGTQFTTIGPLSMREQIRVIDGTMLISPVAIVDPAQGYQVAAGQYIVAQAGATLYMRPLTATATVIREDASTSGADRSNALLIGPPVLSALNTDLLTGVVNGYLDVSQWSSATFQFNGSGGISAGAVTVEQSIDGVNWTNALLQQLGSNTLNAATSALTIAASTFPQYALKIVCPYLRARISTAFVSGTVQAYAHLRNDPMSNPVVTVQQASTNLVVTPLTNIYFNDSVVAQAASATVTGTGRDVGAAASAKMAYAAFNAFAFADAAGTLRIEASNDNATWYRVTADTAVAANTPVYLSVPVTTRYHRAFYVNGAAPQTSFKLNTSLTAA